MAGELSFTGVFPILVTPFDGREEIDLASFARVVRFMADIGVDGVTILGVLGSRTGSGTVSGSSSSGPPFPRRRGGSR